MPSKPSDPVPSRPNPAVGQVWQDSSGLYLIVKEDGESHLDAVYEDGTTVHGINPSMIKLDTFIGVLASMTVAACNDLARAFYKAHGYEVKDDYRFYEATHPQEVSMWNLAVMAYEHIEGTDVLEALAEINGDYE